ncbi:MAG: methyl-accepting chemotaxis protein, partial [Thermodesulfobacteriota bacterium]
MPPLSIWPLLALAGISIILSPVFQLLGFSSWTSHAATGAGAVLLIVSMRSLSRGLAAFRLAVRGGALPEDARAGLAPEFSDIAGESADIVRASRRELGFMTALVKGFPLPLLTVDRDAAISFVNQPALDMLQIPGTPASWLGRKAGEFFYEDPSRDTNVAKVMREAQDKITGETVLTGRKGRKVHVQADRLKLYDLESALIGGMCVYNDLTAIRISEKLALERAESLRSAAAEIGRISEGLLGASQELDAEIAQVARGSLGQCERTVKAVDNLRELNKSVFLVAENAEAASSAALDTERKASEGAVVVERSVEAINQVERTARLLSQDMTTLSERSRSIGRVLDMITDIADQTNLLALNAA